MARSTTKSNSNSSKNQQQQQQQQEQQHHSIAPAPEAETPLPAAWREAPPKATATAATTAATTATTTATRATTATAGSQQLRASSQQEQQHRRGIRGNRARDLLDTGWFWWSWCLCLCLCLWLGWGGGLVFRRSKSASHRHYQLQFGPYKQKEVQTSNPSSSPAPLDTPARPADLGLYSEVEPPFILFLNKIWHQIKTFVGNTANLNWKVTSWPSLCSWCRGLYYIKGYPLLLGKKSHRPPRSDGPILEPLHTTINMTSPIGSMTPGIFTYIWHRFMHVWIIYLH